MDEKVGGFVCVSRLFLSRR